MLLLATMAFAAEVRTPPPKTVATVAVGLSFSRKGDDAEGGLPEPPTSTTQDATDAWIKQVDAQKDRMSDYVEADWTLKNYAPGIADCAVRAGSAVGAAVTARLTFGSDAMVRVLPTKGGDPALSACLVSALDKKVTGAAMHYVSFVQPTYTITLTGAPAAVPSLLDTDASFASLAFGGPSKDLYEAHLGTAYGNTRHYTREIDENIRYLGVRCALVLDIEAEFGLYAATVVVHGDTGAFQLQERLKARFGDGRWDNNTHAWYWRGERLEFVSVRSDDGEYVTLRIFDMALARKAGAVLKLPGDPVENAAVGGQEVPSFLRNLPGTREKPVSSAPAPIAGDVSSPAPAPAPPAAPPSDPASPKP